MKLFFTANEKLYDKTIEDVFDEHVFDSDFWLYWRTMFAFENWHSALEMKLYLQRFIHHIGGLPDFSALKFTEPVMEIICSLTFIILLQTVPPLALS